MKKWKDRSKEEQDQIKCNVLLGIAAGVGLVAGVGGCLAVNKIVHGAYKKKYCERRIVTTWDDGVDAFNIFIQDVTPLGQEGRTRSGVSYSRDVAEEVLKGVNEHFGEFNKMIDSQKFNEAIDAAVEAK